MKVLYNTIKNFHNNPKEKKIKKELSQNNILIKLERDLSPIKKKNFQNEKKSPLKKIIINNKIIFPQNKEKILYFPEIEKNQNEKFNSSKSESMKSLFFKKDIFLKMKNGNSLNLLNKSLSKTNFKETKNNEVQKYNLSFMNNKNIKDKLFYKFKLVKNKNNSIDISLLNNNNNNYIFLNNTFSKNKKKEIIKQFSVYSKGGEKEDGKQKINQDSFLILTKINNILNFNIFAVFDGHGINGHLVSKYISNYFKKKFKNEEQIKNMKETEEIYNKLKENNYSIIQNYFINAEKELINTSFNCDFSGTTCVLLIQIGIHLICANVGDSRAILINEKEINQYVNNNINNNKYDIIQLSYDNKPNNIKEKKRIIKLGGKVEKFINNGPFRVWIKNKNYPGLAMSRSIGDLIASNIGVIPIPEIIEYTINKFSKFILICSDGIWEFLNNVQVLHICKKFYYNDDSKGLCFQLVKNAENIWKQKGNTVDDITVLAIFL